MGNLNYGSNLVTSNAFAGFGTENGELIGNIGSIGEIWGSSPISAQGRGSGSLSGRNIGYDIGENNFGGRPGNARNNGTTSITNSIRDGGLGN